MHNYTWPWNTVSRTLSASTFSERCAVQLWNGKSVLLSYQSIGFLNTIETYYKRSCSTIFPFKLPFQFSLEFTHLRMHSHYILYMCVYIFNKKRCKIKILFCVGPLPQMLLLTDVLEADPTPASSLTPAPLYQTKYVLRNLGGVDHKQLPFYHSSPGKTRK